MNQIYEQHKASEANKKLKVRSDKMNLLKKNAVLISGIIGSIALLYCIYEIICGLFYTPDNQRGLRIIIGSFIFYVATETSKKFEKINKKGKGKTL